MTNFGVWFEISNDIQIKSEYANNTFAISAAIEKMQMKIDSASDEIEKQLEEFEASIDAKSQELEDNLQEQCKKCKDLGPVRESSENDRNHRSLFLTLNLDQERNDDEPSVGPNEMKTNPEDKLLISDKGVTIMKCYQCCEEVELTDQILDRISGGMFSKMNKQAQLNHRIIGFKSKQSDFLMIVSLMKLLKKLSHKALVENTSNLLKYERPIQNIYSQTVQPIERLNQTQIMTSLKL